MVQSHFSPVSVQALLTHACTWKAGGSVVRIELECFWEVCTELQKLKLLFSPCSNWKLKRLELLVRHLGPAFCWRIQGVLLWWDKVVFVCSSCWNHSGMQESRKWLKSWDGRWCTNVKLRWGLCISGAYNPSAQGVAAKLWYSAAKAAWQISCTSIVSPSNMVSIFPLIEDEIIQRSPSANILLVFLQGRDLTCKVRQSCVSSIQWNSSQCAAMAIPRSSGLSALLRTVFTGSAGSCHRKAELFASILVVCMLSKQV